MAQIIIKDTWKECIDKFSSYEGTLTQYCRDNNITKSQFYYYKKRLKEAEESTFYAISFEKEEKIEEVILDNK